MSSGGHSRTSRAAMKWQGRQRGRSRGGSSISVRDEIADIELAAKKWEALAPKLGFCNSCGAMVDEANGKLHDEGCLPGQPERCRVGQRS